MQLQKQGKAWDDLT